MTTDGVDVHRRPTMTWHDVLLTAFVVTLVTTPVLRAVVLWSPESGTNNPNQQVALHIYHLPLMVFSVVAAAHAAHSGVWRRRPTTPPAIAFWCLLAWSAVSAMATPSWRAVDWWLNVGGAMAAAYALVTFPDGHRRRALAAVVALVVLQAGHGIAQAWNGAPLGLDLLEFGQDLYEFGGQHAAEASFGHPYHLATFLMTGIALTLALWITSVGRWRVASGAAFAVLGFALPFTFSRASVLAIVPMVLLGLTSRKHRVHVATGILLAGLLLGTSLTLAGWTQKASKSVDPHRIESGRIELAEQSMDLMQEHPALGVGTGRYAVHLIEQTGEFSLPPHNFVLHMGAETGVPGLVLAAALTAAFGIWAIMQGRLAAIAALSVLPFHLLDSYPHAFPKGILLSGLWVASIVVVGRSSQETPATPLRPGAPTTTDRPTPASTGDADGARHQPGVPR